MSVTESSNKWINWIEDAIKDEYFRYFEYNNFSNIQEVGSGTCGKVYRANCRKYSKDFALKSFFNYNEATIKEVVNEIKLQRKLELCNESIIRFYGVTSYEDKLENSIKYLLVVEYAENGTLRDFLKEHFKTLTVINKLTLAHNLVSAVSCLHAEGIFHRDLYSGNVLVHRGIAKLADLGLSKRIEESTNSQSKIFRTVPYVDPEYLKNPTNPHLLNDKSDVYSIGVILWEIFSGRPPFEDRSNEIGLVLDILKGVRETPTPNTPENYIMLYTKCWSSDPDSRPNVNQVINKLILLIENDENSNSEIIVNSDAENLSQDDMNIENDIEMDIDYVTNVNEIEKTSQDINTRDIISHNTQNSNKTNTKEAETQIINRAANINNLINSQEVYNWIKDSNDLYEKSNESGIGTSADKKLEFEIYQKAANLGNAHGMNNLGCCYESGIGTDVDKQKAFELYQKAASLGNPYGMNNLGHCYHNGIGTNIDKKKAFEFYQKATDLGNLYGMNNLGNCYISGIGTGVNQQKAFELYQMAAGLGYRDAQFNLAYMYEHGYGVMKDMNRAIYWYEQSSMQQLEVAQYKLRSLYK